ncbi:MAG: GH92 family glycosyl hydrolase [Holophagales bacterium]|jgi:predicted alpha-1,2-mannosidase|nr:GH92 family glycosyl hydrolase [Holophagales bacterium]
MKKSKLSATLFPLSLLLLLPQINWHKGPQQVPNRLAQVKPSADKKVSFIKPLVGTHGEGNTYPGPTTPFGMAQFGPDTDDALWATASGYEYSDTSIMGFSCAHLSGTGIPDLGDFLFIPQIGEPKIIVGAKTDPDSGYRQRYSHDNETAYCGYYQVKLENNVNVELAAAERSGIMRFTFPESDQASILTDLHHQLHGGRFKMIWSHVRVENNQTVTGFHLVNGWGKERYLYFAAKYSRPFDDHVIMADGKPHIYNTYRFRSRNEASGQNLQFIAKYKTKKDEAIQVKIGISAVSAANAMMNLDAEIPHWNFERVVAETQAKWEKELSVAEIEGTQEEKETFYTALYHTFLTPNIYQDINGEYRGFDFNIHKANGFTRHSVFSLWDTYRAVHPFFNLLQPKRNAEMINSMLAHYDQSVDKLLPVWELDGNETWCMIGYHAVPVIVDAYLKGIKGFDSAKAYDAVKTTAMNPDYDSVALYAKLGYVPFDKENESLSKTLEYAYDDWCIAQMAKALGKNDDYDYFMKRAKNYKNIFDATVGWMRPKDSNGKWREPFDAHNYGGGAANFGDITEGASAQYSWYVPHDVPGLISLMGGKKAFTDKLDGIFTYKGKFSTGEENEDVGTIGEYWHGNEPSHHIIYLYSYVGQPAKAAERIHQVIRTQYGNKPDSLSGNDDCGQMSAWYLFTVMGFYPVCPGCDYYAIGSPCLPKVKYSLANGRYLTVEAKNLSEKNIYVQSLKVNGKDWTNPFLPYQEIINGGTLVFTMGPKPSKWGTNPVIPER